MKPKSAALIVVWAIEQEPNSRFAFTETESIVNL
jgi:hypothetical protein